MRPRTMLRLAAALAALAASGGAASAACTRAVYNNSPYLLAFSQDGGPGVLVAPGGRRPIRLERAGQIALAAYCPGAYAADPASRPVAQDSFDYVADPGICFMKFGYNGLTPYANRIDPDNGTRPFVVNNPHQGDVVLGPFGPACPPAADPPLVRKY